MGQPSGEGVKFISASVIEVHELNTVGADFDEGEGSANKLYVGVTGLGIKIELSEEPLADGGAHACAFGEFALQDGRRNVSAGKNGELGLGKRLELNRTAVNRTEQVATTLWPQKLG